MGNIDENLYGERAVRAPPSYSNDVVYTAPGRSTGVLCGGSLVIYHQVAILTALPKPQQQSLRSERPTSF